MYITGELANGPETSYNGMALGTHSGTYVAAVDQTGDITWIHSLADNSGIIIRVQCLALDGASGALFVACESSGNFTWNSSSTVGSTTRVEVIVAAFNASRGEDWSQVVLSDRTVRAAGITAAAGQVVLHTVRKECEFQTPLAQWMDQRVINTAVSGCARLRGGNWTWARQFPDRANNVPKISSVLNDGTNWSIGPRQERAGRMAAGRMTARGTKGSLPSARGLTRAAT